MSSQRDVLNCGNKNLSVCYRLDKTHKDSQLVSKGRVFLIKFLIRNLTISSEGIKERLRKATFLIVAS